MLDQKELHMDRSAAAEVMEKAQLLDLKPTAVLRLERNMGMLRL